MRSLRASTLRAASISVQRHTIGLALVLLLCPAAQHLFAQTTPPPSDPSNTLHVYTDLIQIPTLALSADLKPLPPVTKNEFNIRLDAGPSFHPTHLRLEGNDPIDLAILLDLSGNAYDMQSVLLESIAAFAATSLLPHDRISIYAIDCVLIRTADSIPASDAAHITAALHTAIDFPKLHGSAKRTPGCTKSIHLWNALANVAQSLGSAPGRRVILAISNGRDANSLIKWDQLKRFAEARSISIFGLFPEPVFGPRFFQTVDSEDPFNQLCELTGGIMIFTTYTSVPTYLKRFNELLRGRYILEFPRPDQGIPGQHRIDVALSNANAFIRPSGIAVPIADPNELSSPNTIQSPPSPAIFGKRRPLKPN